MDHKIFNERPECQDRLIKVLENLGYKYGHLGYIYTGLDKM